MAATANRPAGQYLRQLFSLKPETDYAATLNQIKAGVDFKGGNLWALIFAILVASVGLNVNSTAVIIGAMLISPLMGPIMGIGHGIAVHDFALARSALKNVVISTVIGLVVSALCFMLTPLSEAQSELLARTSPT